MTHSAETSDFLQRAVLPLRGRSLALGGLALAFGVAGAIAEDHARILFVLGGSLGLLAAGTGLLSLRGWMSGRSLSSRISHFAEMDVAAILVTNSAGQVQYSNRTARRMLGDDAVTIEKALDARFADPQAVVGRLGARAAVDGAAHEDIVTRRGPVRLSAHRMGSCLLWRLDVFALVAEELHGAEGISMPMLVVGQGGSIRFQNAAMTEFLGHHPRNIDRILSEAPRSGEEMQVATSHGPKVALTAVFQRQSGQSEMFLLPSATSDADNQLRGSLDELPVALLWLTARGGIGSANRSARELLALGEEDAFLGDLVEGLGRPVQDWLSEAMSGRGLNRPEVLRAIRRDEETYVQIVLRRVVNAGRASLVAVLSDATEHKNLQSQFFQSQKMQAIGQFAGGIAHDFNNLLTAISGHCDLLLLRHDHGDPEYADLEQIRQNSHRAASLVGQLLAFSRKQTMQAEVLDLREVLSDLTHLLNRLVGEKVKLTFSHDDKLRTVRADKRQLEQVMMNLVVNARDAMQARGVIRICTEERRFTEAFERDRATVPPGDYALVEVIDEGSGIPPERLGKIFEPFYTTKRPGEGTGLGLSTVYGIIKQSGAFIFVDSEVGKGTTFSIYFPIHVAKEAPAPAVAVPAAPALLRQGGGVVLLVEDEAPVRAFAARALRLRGFTVLEAANGEDALDLLKDPQLAVDLFVTDVIMPGMDGPTWVRKALTDRPDIKVVFVSGYAEESFTEAQSHIPNSVFLPKPFSLAQLTETVQASLF